MKPAVLIKNKLILHKQTPIRHFFKLKNGMMIENLRFKIKYCKCNPKHMKWHIQIWLPLIHISRDNSKWEFGNKWQFHLYHK